MNSCNNAAAVHELLRSVSAPACIENLDELWESWLISDASDGTTADQRSQMLYFYKSLRQMLKTIEPVL